MTVKLIIELPEEAANKLLENRQEYLDRMLSLGLPVMDIHEATAEEIADSRDINQWPFPAIELQWLAGDRSWREISQDIYNNLLGAVPPARLLHTAFALGEAWTKDIHAMCIRVADRCFIRMDHLENFDPDNYLREIMKQLGYQ